MKLWILFFVLAFDMCLTCRMKIKMDVYYESLCPDSKRFLIEHLVPAYETFKNNLDITFVPFGKSSSSQNPDGTIEFECQHGPDECFGNKVQACMFSRMDQDTQVAYVSCQMQLNADRTHRECVERFNVQWDDILNCVHSDFATKQQLAYEKITHPVTNVTNWVPSIVYNGIIDNNSHTGRAAPFQTVLCQLLANNGPDCQCLET